MGTPMAGNDDALVKTAPLLEIVNDWQSFLLQQDEEGEVALKRHERTGRPIGDDRFISSLETKLGRILSLGKPGRPKKK